MVPKISLIIPCYNSEATLEATLESVLNQIFDEWEAIIVNDGSTDSTEQIAKKWIEKDQRFKYFFKKNEGLGKARNYGIERAAGTFILPLDSDNLVDKYFCKKALEVFKNNETVDVVHGYAEYFGEKQGLWKIDDFDIQKMLADNYIDACAIFKKVLWEKAGGYDEEMPHQGHEDWEFWISISNYGAVFFNLHAVTFKYFVSNKSMIHSFTSDMFFLNRDYIVKKHSKLYYDHYAKIVSARAKELRRLTSKKFVIDIFMDTFFGFRIFNRKRHK
ncbi:glycosyltransferase family 2 protein [Flavobacterium panacagri]|uniref:glycosyltransferase family 2 protein n=1 Tax=Flavobacterium panacagri TaxID=3034146 RepID=UPI0025A5FE60|nr:glycosyltransferase family 2 protein [Flavobacterium panacagri]